MGIGVTHIKTTIVVVLAALLLAAFASGHAPWASSDGQRRTQTVAFDSTDLTLKGTLELPARASADHPVPAAVFVHGSGPHARDQSMSAQLGMRFPQAIPVFDDLADALADAGFASLRYDKRTCGPFNGCADNGYPPPAQDASVTDFIDDSLAAVDLLGSFSEVDKERIVYIGHSQGGTFAFEALARRSSLAGAILLATPRRSIDKIFAAQADQLRDALEQQGAASGTIDAQVGPIKDIARQLRALHDGTYSGSKMISGAPVSFWKDWFAITDQIDEQVATLERGVLVILGGYDWNVLPEEAAHWRETFANAPEGVDHRVEVLPEITHALNRITEPDWRKIQPADIGTDVDAQVIEAVTAYFEGL